MRILLYGMQSSGATLCAFILGQAPRSVVIADLFHGKLMPSLDDTTDAVSNVVAKCTVTTRYDLAAHKSSFRPDRTVLVLRNPATNYVSLSRKPHKDWSGGMDEKFRLLERYFRDRDCHFDAVVRYEDMVMRPRLFARTLTEAGIPFDLSYFKIPRTRLNILEYNAENSDWCRNNFRVEWGFGRIRSDAMESRHADKYVPAEIEDRVKELCPTVHAGYADYAVPFLVRFRSAYVYDLLWQRCVRKPIRKLYRRLQPS